MKYSKLTTLLTSLILVAAAAFTACSDFDDMEIPTEELYTREFIKQFGVFDSNHNWNLATEASITINPQSFINEAKVYARYDGKYYYVARAINCYKSFTLNFDVPSGVTDLKLVVDGTTYYAQSGTTLVVGGGNSRLSRTIYPVTEADYIYVHECDTVLEMDPTDVLSYDLTLPEEKNNLGKVTEDFFFVSNGTFTIYPVFWQTRHQNTIGLYTRTTNPTTEEEEITIYPIYKNDQTNKGLQYKKERYFAFPTEYCKTIVNKEFSNYTESEWTTLKTSLVEYANSNARTVWGDGTVKAESVTSYEKPGEWVNTATNDGSEFAWNDGSYHNIQISSSNSLLVKFSSTWMNCPVGDGQNQKSSYPKVWNSDGTEVNDPSAYIFKGKGITITVAEDVQFGMYLYNPDDTYDCTRPVNDNSPTVNDTKKGTYFYSESAYNKQNYKDSSGNEVTTKRACHAATYIYNCSHGDTYRVLAFEDWPNIGNGSDMDLNDMVFFITSSEPTRIPSVEDKSDTGFEWIIAAEDLGTTDDFDFNDMIVGVNSSITYDGTLGYDVTTLTFTPLAAGGTLPLYLYLEPYGYTTDSSTDIKLSIDYDNSDITTDGILYPHNLGSDYAEWHAWFDNGTISSGTMINTGQYSATTLNQCKVVINGHFSIASYSHVTNGTLKGFYISVNGYSTSYDPSQSSWTVSGGSSTDYNAPQMFVITDKGPNNRKWLWPTERTFILDAYPMFQNWAQNHENTTYQNWHTDRTNATGGIISRSGNKSYRIITASGGS